MRAHENEKRPAEVEQEKAPVKAEREQEGEKREEEPQTKYAANGNVPPVGGEFQQQTGSANLAFEASEHERELKAKVNELVQSRFDGDLKRAFEHYDLDNNGAVNKGEILNLLSDASVGNKQTRAIIADKLVDKAVNSRANGGELQLEWSEFEPVFKARA
jgi:dihydroxyacetone kinase-like predicted kinase